MKLFGRSRQLTDAQLALLSLYLKPRGLDIATWQGVWTETMGEPYVRVIQRFLDEGLLQRASPRECASMSTVSELKDALRKAGLKVSGRKDELLDRLARDAPSMFAELAAKHPVLICSDLGRQTVQPWVDRIERARQDADAAVAAALESGQCERAARAIAAYRRLFPPPMQGVLGVSASSEGEISDGAALQRCIGVPELLAMPAPEGADLAAFAEYRIEAATDWLWGKRLGGPIEFRKVAYRAAFGAVAKARLDEYRQSDVLKGVIVSTAPDACESCKAIAAAGPYTFDNAPIIPNPDCDRDWCRCCYIPWTKSWEELGIYGMPEEPKR